MAVIKMDGHTLVIEVDTSAGAIAKAPLSASKKTKLLTNLRFAPVEGAPEGLLVNCCVMVPPVAAKSAAVAEEPAAAVLAKLGLDAAQIAKLLSAQAAPKVNGRSARK